MQALFRPIITKLDLGSIFRGLLTQKRSEKAEEAAAWVVVDPRGTLCTSSTRTTKPVAHLFLGSHAF
jgi:hypothetical protein